MVRQARPLRKFSDTLTLSQPGGQIMPPIGFASPILQNLHLTFVLCSAVKINFAKFYGLLIYMNFNQEASENSAIRRAFNAIPSKQEGNYVLLNYLVQN